jgi:hypothetical protein
MRHRHKHKRIMRTQYSYQLMFNEIGINVLARLTKHFESIVQRFVDRVNQGN